MGNLRIILFGIGENTDRLLTIIKEEVEVTCCIDNDPQKHGKLYHGKTIYSVKEGIEFNYDYVVIGFTAGYDDAVIQLKEMGVDDDCIIVPYSFNHLKYNCWSKVLSIYELNYIEIDLRLKKIEDAIENLPYEIFDALENNKIWLPHIKSWKETIEELVRTGASLSRFGDGEFDLILGRSCSLQKNDSKLAVRLKEVLHSDVDDLLVGIPKVFGMHENRRELYIEVFRRNLAKGGRREIYNLLKKDKVYYDSFVTRPYKDYIDKSDAEEQFKMIKKLWEGRDVTIIEGDKSRLGVGNDLFESAKSINRLLCPTTNAFDKYEEIYRAALKIKKNRLILIALGPTATVLAFDLSLQGYQAIDIGHIDIEYEWFLRKEIVAIKGKYVNEVPKGRIVVDDVLDSKYKEEICGIIQ